MNKVLITGITGFVGSRLADRLQHTGIRVVGIARDRNQLENDAIKCYTGDVNDYSLIRHVVAYEDIDTIYHLAASAIVNASAKDPVSTYQTNVMGTVNVLEAARSAGNVTVIVASSDKAYGDHEDLPYTEQHALQPENTYDTSKACADMIARAYAHNYGERDGLAVCVTRSSNIYGPGDKNFSRIIPNTIRRLSQGLPPVLYDNAAQMEREFVYIDDVLSAYVLLGNVQNHHGSVFNIGGTGPESIAWLIIEITRIMGKTDLEMVYRPRDARCKEIQKQYVSADNLNALGWQPKVSLREGLQRTIPWYEYLFWKGE